MCFLLLSYTEQRGFSLREFSIFGASHYNQSGPTHWILSHMLCYKRLLVGYFLTLLLGSLGSNAISLLIGNAFNAVLQANRQQLLHLCLILPYWRSDEH